MLALPASCRNMGDGLYAKEVRLVLMVVAKMRGIGHCLENAEGKPTDGGIQPEYSLQTIAERLPLSSCSILGFAASNNRNVWAF